MKYSLDHFQLQVVFAQKIAEITGKDLMDCLLEYTQFYKRFEIPGWKKDPENVVWKEFLRYVKTKEDIALSAYEFHLKCPVLEKTRKRYGCFSYDWREDTKDIHIHFENYDTSEESPLSKDRIGVRTQELTEMFQDIAQDHPDAKNVCGYSWLYNISAYRSLFPAEYTHNMKEIQDYFQSLSLWGQFLDRNREVRKEMSKKFIECIKKQTTLDQVVSCFPFKIKAPEISIEYFYSFLKINR